MMASQHVTSILSFGLFFLVGISQAFVLPQATSSTTTTASKPHLSSMSSLQAAASSSSSSSNNNIPQQADSLKKQLLRQIDMLRAIQATTVDDSNLVIDFGVKGGELNATTRAPQRVDYYKISSAAGQTADEIVHLCQELATYNPTTNATQYFGDAVQGAQLSPLHGTWKLLFSTAADATFTKNSKRGDAQAQNIVNAATGRITNVIQFLPNNNNQKPPALRELNVVIAAKRLQDNRIGLTFKYAKAIFNRFLFWNIKWKLYIPVPAPFLTRWIVWLGRIVRFFSLSGRRKHVVIKRPPQAYFDILYLDHQLRIQKTGEDNIFVQARPDWKAAQGLFKA